jgi:hypothetical protein
MHAICDDLRMRYVGLFSPEMRDLLHEEGQAQPTRTAWTPGPSQTPDPAQMVDSGSSYSREQ